MEGATSARSARSRTQVGTTNRSTTLPAASFTDTRGGGDDRTASGPSRAGTKSVIRPRVTSSVNGPASRGPLASSRSQNLVRDKSRDSLCTSRSMPSLTGQAGAPGGPGSSRGDNGADQNGELEGISGNKEGGKDGMLSERIQGLANDAYMTSTQMAYMSGLHAPESKTPVMDPYSHRRLLHDRWINRASQRLGDLASLKYGSVREFFRLYDENCDGLLEFDEFSKGITMCQLDHLFPRSLQRTLFDRIDADKSGTIELNEFATFLGGAAVQGARSAGTSVWQKQSNEQQRKVGNLETRSVQLQPIQDHKTQRIKNKLSHCLNKAVPSSSAGLADNRTMFLKKQFAFLNENAPSRGLRIEDLARALGPRGMNLGVNEEDMGLLLKEMDTNGDGDVTLKEFASFLNLDDDEPLYQPLFDGRRRNVSAIQSAVEAPAPAASPEEEFFKVKAGQLHSAAVPSIMLDEVVRMERSKADLSMKGKRMHRSIRPESPPWTVGEDSMTVSTPSGRTVVDVWDLPPPTRHLSSVKRSLTSAMRYLPCTLPGGKDGSVVSFASDGGPFAVSSPQQASPTRTKALSSLSGSQDLFSSLEEGRSQEATAGALARSRKVAKPTWADIGHGGIGDDAGTDESSSYYAGPGERFTTTNSERYAPLFKEKKIEKGQRSAWFYRQRPGDSTTEASQRQRRSEERSNNTRAHLERISLSIKTQEVAARLKGERRVRGKARTRLRYNQWINSMDNWLNDEVPSLADHDKRQFPAQNVRFRSGQQVHEALGGPMAVAV